MEPIYCAFLMKMSYIIHHIINSHLSSIIHIVMAYTVKNNRPLTRSKLHAFFIAVSLHFSIYKCLKIVCLTGSIKSNSNHI